MKSHIAFLSALTLVLAAFVYMAVTFNERDLFLFQGSGADLKTQLNRFESSHWPMTEVNFSAIYGQQGQFAVLSPLLDLRHLRFAPAAPSCERRAVDVPAGFYLADGGVDQSPSDKMDQLEELLKDGKPVPESFATTPPFIDRIGGSFAYLLVHQDLKPFNTKSWVQSHLAFFKVSELPEILKTFHLEDPRFSVIARLSPQETDQVIRGAPVVLTKDFLLFKNQIKLGFSPLSYWVYDIRDVNSYFKSGDYELAVYTAGALCREHLGNVCWTYNSKHALGYLYRNSVAWLSLMGLAFFIFVCFYLKYIFEISREQKKNRLALQVLSHEFRTPVSALLLMLESGAGRDEEWQARVSSEVYRLQRILEVSQTYLQAEKGAIPFQRREIASANEWIADFASDFHGKVHVEFLRGDCSFRADPFWLKFVLSSLVHNAFAHGKEPVWIRLCDEDGELRITVEDQGECEFRSWREMSDPFIKSSRSRGMGLGLNIVKFIVAEWGGEIQFRHDPTSFTLKLTERGARA